MSFFALLFLAMMTGMSVSWLPLLTFILLLSYGPKLQTIDLDHDDAVSAMESPIQLSEVHPDPNEREIYEEPPKIVTKVLLALSAIFAFLHFFWPNFNLGEEPSIFLIAIVAAPQWLATVSSVIAPAITANDCKILNERQKNSRYLLNGIPQKKEHRLFRRCAEIAAIILTWDIVGQIFLCLIAPIFWADLPPYESGSWAVELEWLLLGLLFMFLIVCYTVVAILILLPLIVHRERSDNYHRQLDLQRNEAKHGRGTQGQSSAPKFEKAPEHGSDTVDKTCKSESSLIHGCTQASCLLFTISPGLNSILTRRPQSCSVNYLLFFDGVQLGGLS